MSALRNFLWVQREYLFLLRRGVSATVEIKHPNQHGASVVVEGQKMFKIIKIGTGWTVTPIGGGKVEFYETRDDAIAAMLSQVWDI